MPPSDEAGPSSPYSIPRPGKINLKETKAERAQRVYEREARREKHRRNLISRANGYGVSPPRRNAARDESITPPRFPPASNSKGKEGRPIDLVDDDDDDDDDGWSDEIQETGYRWMGDLGRSAKRMRVEQERMEQLEQEELMAREGDPFTSFASTSTSTSTSFAYESYVHTSTSTTSTSTYSHSHSQSYSFTSQSIPARHRPPSHLHRERSPVRGRAVPDIGSMTDEEYATYIRSGFNKTHREAEAAESARRKEERRRVEIEKEKARMQEEKKERKKEKERQRKFHQDRDHHQGQKRTGARPGPGGGSDTDTNTSSDTDDGVQEITTDYKSFKRQRYLSRWASLNQRAEIVPPPNPSSKSNGADAIGVDEGDGIEEIEMRYSDIPWPSYSGTLDKVDIRVFLQDMSRTGTGAAGGGSAGAASLGAGGGSVGAGGVGGAGGAGNGGDLRKTLRETIRIYHPDKFLGKYLSRVREGDREKVKEGVERVSRAINDLMGETNGR